MVDPWGASPLGIVGGVVGGVLGAASGIATASSLGAQSPLAWAGTIAGSAAIGAGAGFIGGTVAPLAGVNAILAGAGIGAAAGVLNNALEQVAGKLICPLPNGFGLDTRALATSAVIGGLAGGLGGAVGAGLSYGIRGPRHLWGAGLGGFRLQGAWSLRGTQEAILGIAGATGWASDVTLNAIR